MNHSFIIKKTLLHWYLQNGVEKSLVNCKTNKKSELNPKKRLEEKKYSNLDQKNENYENPFSNKEKSKKNISAKNLKELVKEIQEFEECPLKKTATKLVFADGNPNASVMLIGEAPGAEEDKSGLPFVGQAGKLLDKMLNAINQDRNNTYLSNIIFWRPPGNRSPTDEEVNSCLPFVIKHIEIIRPKILILAGAIASKAILQNRDEGITQLRGRWQDLNLDNNSLKIKAMPIFHPAFLLRQPARKREAWEDLKLIKKAIDGL